MTEARSDLWHVQMASGDVLIMNLDELDDAFNSGRIDESTMVLQGGSLKWARLGEILGDEEPELPAFTSPMETAGRQIVVPTPFVQTLSTTPTPVPSRASSGRAQACALALDNDVVTPSVRPLAYDISSTTDFADDDFDPDMASLRTSKKKLVFGVLGAAAVVAIGVVGMTKVTASAAVSASNANASIAQAAAAAAPAPAKPQTTTPADVGVNLDSLPGSRLSDDQKAALSKMDKKLAEQQAAKEAALAEKAAKRAATHHGKFKAGKSGFHEGGDPHDPLNAKLNSKSKGW